MKLIWSKRSRADLKDIADYIAGDNKAAARRVVGKILNHADALEKNPYLGRRGLISGTRELVIGGLPYLLVYSVSPDQVSILFVHHGAREQPTSIDLG